MARASMTSLIAHVRNLIDDNAGTPQFDDDQIQTHLDDHRTEYRYVPLSPLETVQSGGNIVYLDYVAPVGWWEDSISLVDGNYDTLSADTEDLQTGRFTFASHTEEPVYLTGYSYDVYGTSVSLLQVWLAKLKGEFDFDADGGRFRLTQKTDKIKSLVELYQTRMANGGVTTGEMFRSDLNPQGWGSKSGTYLGRHIRNRR